MTGLTTILTEGELKMTNKQREDAIDALSDIKRVIGWLEAGESSLEEVARVWWDNIHYISPVLALALPKLRPAHEDEEEGSRTDAA